LKNNTNVFKMTTITKLMLVLFFWYLKTIGQLHHVLETNFSTRNAMQKLKLILCIIQQKKFNINICC